MNNTQIIALDMDGTITQHKTPLEKENRKVLEELQKRYRLVMVGAGSYQRIYNQLEEFPIDVIGSYGMEISLFDSKEKELKLVHKERQPVANQKEMENRITKIREEFGYRDYIGDSVEFHDSGMMTFALLGTKANINDKLAFDPTRTKRWPMYKSVSKAFSEYTVFIGGSSSFDIVPKPFDKLFAIKKYCKEIGIPSEKMIYFGDDFGIGGNDEQVFNSHIRFVTMKSYLDFPHMSKFLLL